MVGEFDAFISYSRRASTGLATDLQTAVERFAKPVFRLRAVRVFRDDQSMSANTALWSTIERGLTQAGWFVLLASPAAAASAYVANEVRWWLEHKSSDRILIVLEEGVDIAWDRATNDFDLAVTDSLPPPLAGAFAEEPRWIDLRWYEADGSLRQADPRWQERVADIAAAVRGIERDQLVGENVRAHRRLRRLGQGAIATLSVLLVLALVAAGIALNQRSAARHQTRVAVAQRRVATTQARIALGRQLAAEAVSLAPTDLQTASLLAVQAFRTDDDAQTRAALFQLATASPHLVRTLDVGHTVSAAAVTPDGVVVTGDQHGDVRRWDGARSTVLAHLADPVGSVAVSDDGSVVAAADGHHAVVLAHGSAHALAELPEPTTVAVNGPGTVIAASSDSALAAWNDGGAGFVGRLPVGGNRLALGADGLVATSTANSEWTSVPYGSFQVGASGGLGAQGAEAPVSADGRTLAVLNGETDVPVWRGASAFPTRGGETRGSDVVHSDVIGVTGALSADGSLLALRSADGLEVGTVQSPRAAVQQSVVLSGAGHAVTDNYQALVFGGNRWLVSASGATAYVWDLTQSSRFGLETAVTVPQPCQACGAPTVSVAPDGARALVTAADGSGTTVVTLSDGTQRQLGASSASGAGLTGASWLDASHVLAGSGAGLVSVDVVDGKEESVLDQGLGGPDSVARPLATHVVPVDPTHAVVLMTTGDVDVVDLQDGAVEHDYRALRGASDAQVGGVAPDGSTAWVLGSDGDQQVVQVLDTATGKLVWQGSAQTAAYDGQSRLHVFTGETEAVLAGTELADEQPVTVEAYPAPAVDPTGDLVASGGGDGTIALLDLARQGSAFGTVTVPQQNEKSAVSAFTPDGSALVTAIEPTGQPGFPDGSLRVTSLRPADWITAACAVAGRDLTAADWARYGTGPVPADLRCRP